MIDTSKVLKNIQNKYPEFKKISDEEMEVIALIIEGENTYLSDSEWNDILYESEHSEIIQSVLCLEDYYDYRYANALSKHLSFTQIALISQFSSTTNGSVYLIAFDDATEGIEPSVV